MMGEEEEEMAVEKRKKSHHNKKSKKRKIEDESGVTWREGVESGVTWGEEVVEQDECDSSCINKSLGRSANEANNHPATERIRLGEMGGVKRSGCHARRDGRKRIKSGS